MTSANDFAALNEATRIISSVNLAPSVSVVITVRNDPAGIAASLDSLLRQTFAPAEIVVVDGGSSDGTMDTLGRMAALETRLKVISAPGANIARGRNIGTEAAEHEIIATTDAGCIARADWLERLVRPWRDDSRTEFVAGVYTLAWKSLFEQVSGLATMRGQLDPFDPGTFNPSARSMAYTRELWQRVGGWPEWTRFSEDTLFDQRVREARAEWRFAGDAVVSWRPRTTWRALARQFYAYGTGRGMTLIDAPSFHYNIRNLLITGASLVPALFDIRWLGVTALLVAYFYVWTFHRRAARIARRTGRRIAYLMTLGVMWTVLFSNLAGYLVGRWQRRRQGRIVAQSESGVVTVQRDEVAAGRNVREPTRTEVSR